jgi:flagellar biosynthesis regulator FlbT
MLCAGLLRRFGEITPQFNGLLNLRYNWQILTHNHNMNTTQKTTPKLQMYYVLTLTMGDRYSIVEILAKSLESAEDKVLRLHDVTAVRAFDDYANAKNQIMAYNSTVYRVIKPGLYLNLN